jgi:hypothetical protein
MTRMFLTLVGVLYLCLAAWCSVSPQTTSRTVGFELRPGAGQSEFLTVYGGLEFGMALFFLLPWVYPSLLQPSLLCCLVIHASLVMFRSVGFALFDQIPSGTVKLAAGEWVIFLAAAALWFRAPRL